MKFTLFIVSLALSQVSHAMLLGPSTGGGGFAVECPATAISDASIELLDLYEGRNSLHYKMTSASGELFADYFASVDRTYSIQQQPDLAELRREEIREHLKNFLLSIKFVNDVNEMPKAVDLGRAPWVPVQCAIGQIAFFEDALNVIYVLRPAWEKMSTLDQAALIQHELWSREARRLGEKTSEQARATVAHIFAIEGAVSLTDGLNENSLRYSTTSLTGKDRFTSFYRTRLVGLGGEIDRLQFQSMYTMSILGKKWIDIPAQDWNLKFGKSVSRPSVYGCIVQTPNQDVQFERAMLGASLSHDISVRVRFKTGEPVEVSIIKAGVVVDVGVVDSKCEGHSPWSH